MELLTFNIGPNETKRFERAGKHFEIIESAAPLNIELNGPNGERADDMRAAVSGLFAELAYGSFEVENPNLFAQRVTIMTGAGRGGSRRSPGVVEVVDSARARVIADGQFVNSLTVATPAAGQFAQAQIWNGSTTKGIALQAIVMLQSDLAQSMTIIGVSAQIAGTVFGLTSKKVTAGGVLNFSGQGLQTVRRNTGTLTGGGDLVGQLGNGFGVNVPAGTFITNVPLTRGPIVVGPGSGIVIASAVAVSGFQALIEGEVFGWVG